MTVNISKLQVMLVEHKGRCAELEELLGRKLKKLSYPAPEKDFKFVFNLAVEFYRHVGAIWALEGILNGTEHDWTKTGVTTAASSEQGGH